MRFLSHHFPWAALLLPGSVNLYLKCSPRTHLTEKGTEENDVNLSLLVQGFSYTTPLTHQKSFDRTNTQYNGQLLKNVKLLMWPHALVADTYSALWFNINRQFTYIYSTHITFFFLL